MSALVNASRQIGIILVLVEMPVKAWISRLSPQASNPLHAESRHEGPAQTQEVVMLLQQVRSRKSDVGYL